MQRVFLTAPDIGEFTYRPGQALRFHLPLPDGGEGRRDYTIRNFDAATGTLAVDVFLHGDTPGPTWARGVMVGDRIVATGPRSRMYIVAERDWHVLSGDETCIPAILHMLEDIQPELQAHAFIEVASLDDRMDIVLPPRVTIEWLIRGEWGADGLVEALRRFDKPDGHGHAYLIGETSIVRRQRQMLLAQGFAKTDISAEGYWRPGRVGGNDLIKDE